MLIHWPDFRFHVEGVVLGVLEPLEPGHISMSLGLPFRDFLATRYLPCGPSEQPVQKFTGNADCGAAPSKKDAMTAAIHAFTHFTMKYSDEHLVLCDLQGEVSFSHNHHLLTILFAWVIRHV